MAGFTNIGNVHGYLINEGRRMPIDESFFTAAYPFRTLWRAALRGIITASRKPPTFCSSAIFPQKLELSEFVEYLGSLRDLPYGFTEVMIIKAPSQNIMNKLARSVLALYSYDDNPDDTSSTT
jgi:citrate synthase